MENLIVCEQCYNKLCNIPTRISFLNRYSNKYKDITNTCPCLKCPLVLICRDECEIRYKYYSTIEVRVCDLRGFK